MASDAIYFTVLFLSFSFLPHPCSHIFSWCLLSLVVAWVVVLLKYWFPISTSLVFTSLTFSLSLFSNLSPIFHSLLPLSLFVSLSFSFFSTVLFHKKTLLTHGTPLVSQFCSSTLSSYEPFHSTAHSLQRTFLWAGGFPACLLSSTHRIAPEASAQNCLSSDCDQWRRIHIAQL